jgi:hypothetical protein
MSASLVVRPAIPLECRARKTTLQINDSQQPAGQCATIQTVDIGNGITLHYVHQGKGTPVIFVHGSLSDGGYCVGQVGQFAEHCRAIASLLEHLPGDEAKTGEAMYRDIQQRMVLPMQQAFRSGDRDAGIGVFMGYVFNNPHAWDQMTKSAREETRRDAHEWDVMMTSGTLFPDIQPKTIREITVPVLLLSVQNRTGSGAYFRRIGAPPSEPRCDRLTRRWAPNVVPSA